MRIRAAVLGSPIAHSKSPLLHRSAFVALGLDSSEYSRFELDAEQLEDFLDTHPEHTGFSLTMPLKDRLVTLAGERGWAIDDTAALTAAGNTLVRFADRVQVANTDVRGIVRAIAPHLDPDWNRDGRAGAGRATILGAGATAASALVACRDLGITDVDFRVRSPDRAGRVVELAEHIGLRAMVSGLDRIDDSAIVISTLPAEAAPNPVWAQAESCGVALDVAYATDSAFLAAAAAHGMHPVDGSAMLVEQAVAQFEMFFAAAFAEDSFVSSLPTGEGASASATSPEAVLAAGDSLRDRVAAAMYAALLDPLPQTQD